MKGGDIVRVAFILLVIFLICLLGALTATFSILGDIKSTIFMALGILLFCSLIYVL